MDQVEVARWLVSDDGLGAVDECVAMLSAGDGELPVATALRNRGMDPARAAAVLDVSLTRIRARRDWPDADRLLFTRSSLEQASNPEVAAWRALRAPAGVERWDLCAGAGGDTLALARGGPVVAVDTDPVRLVLLEHNAGVRGVAVDARLADALAVSIPRAAHVHADPARRVGDRRVRRLDALVPPVAELVRTHGDVSSMAIVLPPAVDVDDPLLADGEVEFVQRGRDLLEAVLWRCDARRPGAIASATVLSTSGVETPSRTRTEPPRPLETGPVGPYVIEVAPSAVRARLHDEIGREINARRIDPRRALLTSDELPAASMWYQVRRVEAVLPARARSVRAWLRSRDQRPLELRLHGVDADPEQWWRQLGRPPRGPNGRTIELVRTSTGVIVLATHTVHGSDHTDAGSPRTRRSGR